MDATILRDLVAVLAVSLVVVVCLRRVRVPTIAALLVAGLVIGPGGLGLVSDEGNVVAIADIGAALLLFAVGLQLSLRELARLRHVVLGGGGLQVGLTIGIATLAASALGFPLRQGIFLGCLAAMTSTAIILKLLESRGEIDSPHGRMSISISLFQDLAVVPMVLFLPLLAGSEGPTLSATLGTLVKSLAILSLIILLARLVFPRVLERIVRSRSREAFSLATLLVALGTAWLGTKAGVSLVLGAFLAGIVISDSDYAQQILAEVGPLRDSLGSLFFVSVGMLLDPALWLRDPLAPLAIGVAVLAGKFAVYAAVALLFGLGARVAVLTALFGAQVGEFSFILARAGEGHGLVGGALFQQFLSVSVLTMVLSPFLVQLSPRIATTAPVEWRLAIPWLARRKKAARDGPAAELAGAGRSLHDHVIVVGYGLNGRNVARVLRALDVPYVVLELNPFTVRAAREQGEDVRYGDAATRGVLAEAGVTRARVLVVAIADPAATRQIVTMARLASAGLTIVVRTRYVSEVETLYRLGATEVVPEEFETSLELAGAVMTAFGAPTRVVEREKAMIRQERYASLAERDAGAPRPRLALGSMLSAADLDEFAIPEGSPAPGRTLRELDLRGRAGASVVAVERNGELTGNPPPDLALRAGDVLWLWGQPAQLEAARALLGADAGRA